jgi:magnesium transporter
MVKRIRIKSRNEVMAKGGFGTLVEKKPEKVKVTIFDYDEVSFTERIVDGPGECVPPKEGTMRWINIDGLFDKGLVEKVCSNFKLHPLVQKDILNIDTRPKADDLCDYIYIAMKMLYIEKKEVIIEHLSMVLGPNYVITFQERVGDVFDPIRDQIRTGRGRLRKSGADHLAYKIIDAAVDNYFVILDSLREMIEDIEEDVVLDPNPEMLKVIHLLKKELVFLRKMVWPARELINDLQSSESPLIKETTVIYLKDIYYHVIRVVDTIEIIHDIVSDTLDIYLSSVSVRTNAVMKVLTIIATIFMPLTFLVGVYGMNFKDMPELSWVWGYPLVWLVTLLIGVGMLWYFHKEKWI